MKNQSGVTLIILIITIVVIIILTSVSIEIGTESLNSTRLKGFYTQLEIIQKRVDEIAYNNESYINDTGERVYLKEQGNELTSSQKSSLQDIMQAEEINLSVDNFRYFTVSELESKLDLLEMKYDVFINFDNRVVIAEKGIKIADKKYYVLENTTYFVEQNINKNIGTIQSLHYNTIIPYGTGKYKVIVTASNTIGDIGGTGYVKYKKTTTKYWETSNNTEMIIEPAIEYNIIYIDTNENTIEGKIKLELIADASGNKNPTITNVIDT